MTSQNEPKVNKIEHLLKYGYLDLVLDLCMFTGDIYFCGFSFFITCIGKLVASLFVWDLSDEFKENIDI